MFIVISNGLYIKYCWYCFYSSRNELKSDIEEYFLIVIDIGQGYFNK